MRPLADTIWVNGEMTPWAEAKIHVLSHALHYGTSVFEGIRVYETPDGPRGFRLTDHVRRLFDSARMYHFPLPYTEAELVAACKTVVRENGFRSAYIRPIAFLGACGMGVTPQPENMNVDIAIAAFPWGAYLGDDALKNGVDACVSSWSRIAPNTVPSGAKAGGNYLSSYLIGREARVGGFGEGIALGTDGRLSEGAGENLFVVKDGRILTPSAASSILMGITRDSVIRLARAQGIEVVEQTLPREALYVADEVFMTGTAAEITPVRSIDGIATRANGPGSVTQAINAAFRGLFDGTTPDRFGWLESIEAVNAREPEYA
ncbi:branched-chain amino acid transaminase [Brevundimonas vitis]|uniref:Branched-chain-amino-acid aminotransferase n=1 Tax=Brevundimonas vitisensis TaxID=2800818 RepID=A0ABX7BLC3_9CAUL|nr:branched-chain amino acid transaminase [Brevundimonas vitisensis]QQQ18380.1 branched-chain amino acid transaminase [Brevundimonas vitisensis]